MTAIGPTWAEGVRVLAGEQLFTLALGYSQLIMGFGWIIGPPLAGKHFINHK